MEKMPRRYLGNCGKRWKGMYFYQEQGSLPELNKPARIRKKAAENRLSPTSPLIVAVGREAESENAEWLTTHRTRPLEPVCVQKEQSPKNSPF
jgi:hypothetical protein